MRRQAFLLGLSATGSQTLILRELVSCLNGSELFIGTALFGWLVWVALGAYVGGRTRQPFDSTPLFIAGAILLPLVLMLCRFSPLLVTSSLGELIPFSTAAVISIASALPHGFLSGLLFPTLVRAERAETNQIVRVYLVEGIGACVAGVAVTLVAGHWLSTLATALLLAVVIVVLALLRTPSSKTLVVCAAGLMITVTAIGSGIVGRIELLVDTARYPGYQVIKSFDTPYTHQTVLKRDSALVLMTDNTVEANFPDVETSENLLLPALAYLDSPAQATVIGLTEFGVAQLADSLTNVSVFGIDPRGNIAEAVRAPGLTVQHSQLKADIAQYLSTRPAHTGSRECPDAILLPLGDLSSFRISRLVTEETLQKISSWLGDRGILVILGHFDTDRYTSQRTAVILGTLRTTLAQSFSHIMIWPGTTTLLLASNVNIFGISNDSLYGRLGRLPYSPQFVDEIYLRDRLDDFKVERVLMEIANYQDLHTSDRPVMVMKQALHRAEAYAGDRLIASVVFTHNGWLTLIPVGLFALAAYATFTPHRRARLGLLLYLVAGLISLVIELLIFYLYQCNVGSLHAEMAALIGVFMLGLSAGTYVAVRGRTTFGERMSLVLLIISVAALLCWQQVWPTLFAPYAFALILVTSMATGGLFVAATRRYYSEQLTKNQGTGYALEVIGSAIGALLTTTVLLPTIGLFWITLFCLVFLVLTLLACVIVRPAG